MVLTVVLAVLVMSISAYATTNLRYGHVTADRSDRLSAADAGMRYAIDQLKLRNAACIIDTTVAELPRADVDFNGANATITCQRIDSGLDAIQAWAAAITGAGIPNNHVVSTQGGNTEPKVLGGPVFMSRVNSSAFQLGPVLEIENGSLYYNDGNNCATPVTKSQLPAGLVFTPDLIFGPICIQRPWTALFKSPVVAGHVSDPAFPTRRGDLALGDDGGEIDGVQVFGSYEDVGACRVFQPGRYITPPAITGRNSYFQTGDYLFDLPAGNDTILVRQGLLTAGKINPVTTDPEVNEITPSPSCSTAQANDSPPVGGDGQPQYGATFYLANHSHIRVDTQGSVEIHARRQGNSFVSLQTLCTPTGDINQPQNWCTNTASRPDGTPLTSNLIAPATTSSPNVVVTESGNNRELVTHGIVYAPLAQMAFGNVTNSAVQKLYGGVVISRLVLQSSASATNFEIAVPTSPITARIRLTSTAVKNGETSIRAVVEYRPYEEDIDDRIRVTSWRVCNGDC